MSMECAVCGEATRNNNATKSGTTFVTGRACKCVREKMAQAKLDRLKPRCGAVMASYPTYEERCGDHDGHDGAHGQIFITQVQKG